MFSLNKNVWVSLYGIVKSVKTVASSFIKERSINREVESVMGKQLKSCTKVVGASLIDLPLTFKKWRGEGRTDGLTTVL